MDNERSERVLIFIKATRREHLFFTLGVFFGVGVMVAAFLILKR